MDEFLSALWKALPAIMSTLAGYLVYKLKQVDQKRELEAKKTQKLLDTIKLNLKGTRTALQCILDRYHHEAMQQGFTTTRQLRHFSDVYRIYEKYAVEHPDKITAHYLTDMEALPIKEDVAGEKGDDSK